MKKFFRYLIPIATLVIFILVMLSGEYLKRPRNPSEDVIGFVQKAITHVKAENWDEANKNVASLEKAWKKVLPRIQFSVERDEIYNIGVNIAKLKGSALTQDKTSALTELYELMENWDELTR